MGDIVKLPPGFVFSPTDEELILHFLYSKKASLISSHPNFIPDLDPSLLVPWELNDKALCGGNDEYYFFAKVKENKSSTENGHWEEIGVTVPIFSGTDQKVGMKKYLLFHIGELAQSSETSWVMQEYHICSTGFDQSTVSYHGDNKVGENWSEWVLCRVYEIDKNMYPQEGVNYCNSDDDDSGTDLSWQDQVFLSLELEDDMEGITMPQ